MSAYDSDTVRFYEDNAENWESYVEEGYANNLDRRRELVARLTSGADILDAGCGTGHDAEFFRNHGFKVTAFDLSSEMVKIARRRSDAKIRQSSFSEFTTEQRFDAVWANASLIHLPQTQLPPVVAKLGRYLKLSGLFVMLLRYGRSPRRFGRRYFNGVNKKSLREIADQISYLTLEEVRLVPVKPDNSPRWRWLHAEFRRLEY